MKVCTQNDCRYDSQVSCRSEQGQEHENLKIVEMCREVYGTYLSKSWANVELHGHR